MLKIANFIITGGLVAYNLTSLPNVGMIEAPVYRISSDTDGDPGANYTHNNLIYQNASLVLTADDKYIIMQNYGNNDSYDSLIAIDLTVVQSLSGK